MILHLLSDDKFGDYAIRQFFGYEMKSEFIVVADALENIRCADAVSVIKEKSEDFECLKSRLASYRAIVLHGLFYPWQESILRSVPVNVKVAWVFWGGDIYGRKDLSGQYLTPLSRLILRLREVTRYIRLKKKLNRYEVPFDILRRIDYCLTDIPEDFDFVKRYFGTPIKEIWYNYYSIEETIGDMATEKVEGGNILVGNSCSIECNHFDGFRALCQFSLGESRVIVPLSYGEPWLRRLITVIGSLLWGRRFKPLVHFMPRDEYNAIVRNCAVAVMPHYRPQAFGNILTALWLGTRVYLSERNCLYPFFKRLGAVVFSIEKDLKRSNPMALAPLSESEIQRNRSALSSVYSKEVMYSKNLELVGILNQ